MNQEKLKEILEKIPIGLVVVLMALYLGYDYYSFTTDPNSQLMQKQTQLTQLKQQNAAFRTKIKAAKEFYKTLDAKREELRGLAAELEGQKASLSNTIDVPGFMQTVITEASKAGLTVLGIKPTNEADKEYYHEQAFDLNFKGVYLQLLVFLDRMSNLSSIVRVQDFEMKPTGSSLSQYVPIEGKVELLTYAYRGSKADELASSSQSNGAGNGTKPAAKGAAAGGGK